MKSAILLAMCLSGSVTSIYAAREAGRVMLLPHGGDNDARTMMFVAAFFSFCAILAAFGAGMAL